MILAFCKIFRFLLAEYDASIGTICRYSEKSHLDSQYKCRASGCQWRESSSNSHQSSSSSSGYQSYPTSSYSCFCPRTFMECVTDKRCFWHSSEGSSDKGGSSNNGHNGGYGSSSSSSSGYGSSGR